MTEGIRNLDATAGAKIGVDENDLMRKKQKESDLNQARMEQLDFIKVNMNSRQDVLDDVTYVKKLKEEEESGCLSLFTTDLEAPDKTIVTVRYLDYNRKGEALCEKKVELGSVYVQNPAKPRLHLFKDEDGSWFSMVKQTPASCWLHAQAMVIQYLTKGTKLINPFLIAEPVGITAEEYKQYYNQFVSQPDMKATYGEKWLPLAASTGAINVPMQGPEKEGFDSFMRDLGITTTFDYDLKNFPRSDNDGEVPFDSDMFSNEQIQNYLEKGYTLIRASVGDIPSWDVAQQNDKIILPLEDAKIHYGEYVVQRIKEAINGNENNGRSAAVILGLISDKSGAKHAYFYRGTIEQGGKTYIHTWEPHAGDSSGPSTWPYYEGKVLTLSDGSVLLPVDMMWKWEPSIQIMSREKTQEKIAQGNNSE